MDEKTCNSDGYCGHRQLYSIGYECRYAGYCDFQRPRDSRHAYQALSPFVASTELELPKDKAINTTVLAYCQHGFLTEHCLECSRKKSSGEVYGK